MKSSDTITPQSRIHTDLHLQNLFDQVWVINLKRREDRLTKFWDGIANAAWPFRQPTVFNAIEGDKVGVPRFWITGGGSYGCMRSHLAILERAIQDDVDSILVLEDDAIFTPSFGRNVAEFLAAVPKDWQCLMIGGQHVNSTPFPVLPGVVRAGAGGGIQRTHCYALRGQKVMRALYQTWADAAVHCDWVMGPCMAKFNTYAPDPFLVGQSEGNSDISGARNPSKFWRSPSGMEPVVLLSAPRAVIEGLRNKGWHAGFSRDGLTGIDQGLAEIFSDSTLDLTQRTLRLRRWIEMIQWEVASMTEPAVCTVWHPMVTADMVRPLVKGRVIEIRASTEEEALRQLPLDIHTYRPSPQVPESINVVLLRSPRSVMEVLRADGWHTGYWRDDVTGLDNGVRRLFASTTDKSKRSEGLHNLVYTLYEEARQLPNGVVTLWHDEITPDMVESNRIQVIQISANNAHDAKLQLKDAISQQAVPINRESLSRQKTR